MFALKHTRMYVGLLVVLGMMVLAACTGASQTTSQSSPAGDAAPAKAGANAAPAKSNVDEKGRFITPVTIELFSGVQSSELAAPGPDWIVAKAVKEQLNIDLKMTWITNNAEYNRLVLTRAAANDLPDLFRLNTDIARDLGGQGLIADWTPYLKFMPDFVKDRDVEKLAPIGTFDGKLYALTTKNPTPFKQAVSIRKDWLDKLGLQAPKTLDEYLAVMKAFTEKDPDGNGQKDTFGWSGAVNTVGQVTHFDPIFGAFGALGDWKLEDNKLVFVATTPERRDALQFINQMNQAGVIDPDWKTQSDPDFRNKWKAGKIGMFQDDWCATYCGGNYDPFAKANATGKLIDITPPVGPTGKSAVSTYSRVSHQYGMSTRAVQAGKGEAIARLMEWFNNDGHFLVLYGEEGKMWKREGEKVILDQNNEYRIARALAPYGYRGAPEENRTIFDQTATYPNGETVAVWPIVERAEKVAKYDITDFAVLPPAPADRAGDITRLRAEGELQFMTGQRPFSQWDAYVQSLKAAGVDAWQTAAEARAKEAGLLK
jgi:putative aldouronate transport system substrate-binding protein